MRHQVHFPRLSPFDEAGLGGDPGVVGDSGLAFAEWFLQVAAAHLALGGEDGQQPQPHRVGQAASTDARATASASVRGTPAPARTARRGRLRSG